MKTLRDENNKESVFADGNFNNLVFFFYFAQYITPATWRQMFDYKLKVKTKYSFKESMKPYL